MTWIQLTEPVIELRRAEPTEWNANCDACHMPSVYAVLETGSRDGTSVVKREFLMCVDCTGLLRDRMIQRLTRIDDGVMFRGSDHSPVYEGNPLPNASPDQQNK